MQYIAEIPARIAGIPCRIGVESYHCQPPDHGWASDWDCHGYTESDWRILDRRGRPADWLARKLSSKDEDRITDLIDRHFADSVRQDRYERLIEQAMERDELRRGM